MFDDAYRIVSVSGHPLCVMCAANPGFRRHDGSIGRWNGSGAWLSDNATNSVYLTESGVLCVSTTGFPHGSPIVPLATVYTVDGQWDGSQDSRMPLTSVTF